MKNITKNKILLVTLSFLLGFSMLIFTNYQGNLKVSNQPNLKIPNSSTEIKLFDGMYINHTFSSFNESYPSMFSYSNYSGSLFNETWDIMLISYTWLVDSQTRLMSNGSVFGDGTHTPAWIFTDVSLGEVINIAADGEGDHLFNISSELIYDLPGFGPVNVWVLEDLTLPGGVAWYEKSTGILLNGTFFYSGGDYNYTFDFIDTNVEFTSISLRNYIMVENYEYSWIDASGGTELILGDDGYATIPLPFSFTFYNETFSTIYLSSNGYLSFTDSTPWQYSNVAFPSANPIYTYMIAPFWDDLLPPAGGHIYYQSFGTYWVAEWLDIYHIAGPTLLGSFQIVLYDTGEIVFNYDYIDYHSGYTCGLNLGVDTEYYNSYQGLNDLTDDFSILFTYESFDRDLSVSLETPVNPQIGNSYKINATVTNIGSNDEYDVDLLLYFDDVIVDSTTISSLPVGASETISYMWIPPDLGLYNFTAYAPPVTDETYTVNNFITKIIPIVDSQLFDGMLTDYTFIYMGEMIGSSHFLYSYNSGTIFQGDWWINLEGYDYNCFYDVDTTTRIMTDVWGDVFFGVGHHDPGWIFTDTNIGDNIPIAILGAEENIFNVTDELIYNLPGYGPVEVWVLEDLTVPGGIAWYEQSTGILLNGSFITSYGESYILDFTNTNAEFTYTVPPGDFILSSNAGTPDDDGNFDLTWESADGALTYSVYQYSSYITEINGSLTLLGDGITDLSLALSGYTGETYYFIAVAHNIYGDTLSNCIEVVVVGIPPSDFILSSNAGTPDNNGAFDLTWTNSDGALTYSAYQYSSYITEINGSLTLLGDGITDLSLALSGYTDGTYYFIVVAHNAYGDTLSNCIVVTVLITEIPGYNLYFIFAAISIVSAITIRKLHKKRSEY